MKHKVSKKPPLPPPLLFHQSFIHETGLSTWMDGWMDGRKGLYEKNEYDRREKTILLDIFASLGSNH